MVMKKILYLNIVFTVFLFSCKKEQVKEFENAFVGNWKFVSVKDQNTGLSKTKPDSLGNVITTFTANSNNISAQYGGMGCFGKYTLSKNKGIEIDIQRGDFLPAPDGPWLGLYIEAMNKAKEYEVNDTHLYIITNDNRKIFFTKL